MEGSTTDERDAKLKNLIKVMCDRVPKEKRLVVDVVVDLLKMKYTSVFPEDYVCQRRELIKGLLDSFYGSQGNNSGPATVNSTSGNKNENNEDDEDDDEDEEDDEEGSSSEEGEDEESSDEEGDEEDDEEDSNGESCRSGTSEAGEEEEEKPVRGDESKAVKRPRTEECVDDDGGDVGKRCLAMAGCLKFVGYRVRPRGESETKEEYLEGYLVPQFRENGLDPERYSREDARRYRIKREVELLQSDGADINLDRTQRSGRGANVLGGKGAEVVQIKMSKFLDDE
uniref:Uncharacterized protein n=1 Tax=Trypanosoma congolense (strain IL3000) TaxID=1068625 RepID=G0UU35_TRYCI|nr:conserved hypothetical protein [Trypanosoma congolense IL3000]